MTEATRVREGFLARFSFQVLEGFDEGAQVFLDEVTLNSTAGQDVVQPARSAKLVPPVFAMCTKRIL